MGLTQINENADKLLNAFESDKIRSARNAISGVADVNDRKDYGVTS